MLDGPGNEPPRAALYDPAADRIVMVCAGDRILGHEIVSVDPTGVSLKFGTTSARLRLNDQPGSGG